MIKFWYDFVLLSTKSIEDKVFIKIGFKIVSNSLIIYSEMFFFININNIL